MPTIEELRSEIAKRKRVEQVKNLIAQRQQTPQAEAVQTQGQPQERGFVDSALSLGSGLVDSVIGGTEGALALGSGIIAEPIAGLVGLAGAANPFAEEGIGSRNVKAVKDFLTFKPGKRGQQALKPIGETLQPLAEKMKGLQQFIGDDAFAATGHEELAAIATALPAGILEIFGAGVGRKFAKSAAEQVPKQIAQDAAIKGVKATEETTGIRQLTTDILPPETIGGRFLQKQGELLEGGQRAGQQAERITAVDRLLTNLDVDDAARFESSIIQSVKDSIKGKKKAAGDLFKASSDQLAKLGEVPISRTKQFAENTIRTETKKGSLADNVLIKEMQTYIDAPENLNFNSIKSIRTAVGNKLGKAKANAPVVGTSDTGVLSQMYKRLTNDMKAFAEKSSPELSKKWQEADQVFSEFAVGNNKTGVKSIIKQGDATPEIIDRMLFSAKNSDLDFLVSNLDEAGKKAAGQRVLQRILEKSSKTGSINPNTFQAELTKNRNRLGKFLPPEQRKGVSELRKALEQTRRAQDAPVSTPTGQGLIPMLAVLNPKTLAPGLIQALIERPTLRNLLVKRNAAKTARQRTAIDEAMQIEIDKLGLSSAALTGAATSKATEGNQ